jgi:oligosaccharide repeat unit polymerase
MSYLLWGIATLVIAFIWIRLTKKLFNDITCPFALLLPGWIIPLMLKSLGLSMFEKPWKTDTIAIIAWTTFSLIVVCLLAASLMTKKVAFSQNEVFLAMLRLLENRLFKTVVLVWYSIGFAGYIYNEFINNTIQIPIFTFINDPDISRDAAWLGGKDGPLWPLSIPALVIPPILYLMSRLSTTRRQKVGYLALALAYPLMALIKMSRADVMYSGISILMAAYYYRLYSSGGVERRRIAGRWIRNGIIAVALLAACLASATIFQRIRGGIPMAEYTELGIELPLPEPFNSAVTEIYSYLALPFENFSNFVNSYRDLKFHPGIGLLRPIYSILGQGKTARRELDSIDFPLELLPVNTFPFITVIFAEFGWLGVLVVPILYAALVNCIYLRFRRSPNFVNFLAYLMCPYSWLWIATCANFTGIVFYLYLLFPAFIYWQYRVLLGASVQHMVPRPVPVREA